MLQRKFIAIVIFFIPIFDFSNAQITPENENWNELIPNFEHASILEYDTTSSSDYIILSDRFIKTNDGRTILKHDLKLLYGDITRITYTIPRKYANSFIKRHYLEFPKLGYKSKQGGGQVIAFRIYMKYSRYMNSNYNALFNRTKNTKLNNYNELQDNLTYQNLQKLEDSHYLCSYNVYTKKLNNKGFYAISSHGIIKGAEYLFFVDILSPKPKEKNTFSIEKLIVELYNNNRININNILFDTGKATIMNDSKEILEIIADYLTLYSEIKLEINGHTDDVGSNAKNLELSKQRTLAVVNTLVEDYNIEKVRLTANGFGEENPVSSNQTEEGRKQNRRVELVIRD